MHMTAFNFDTHLTMVLVNKIYLLKNGDRYIQTLRTRLFTAYICFFKNKVNFLQNFIQKSTRTSRERFRQKVFGAICIIYVRAVDNSIVPLKIRSSRSFMPTIRYCFPLHVSFTIEHSIINVSFTKRGAKNFTR